MPVPRFPVGAGCKRPMEVFVPATFSQKQRDLLFSWFTTLSESELEELLESYGTMMEWYEKESRAVEAWLRKEGHIPAMA